MLAFGLSAALEGAAGSTRPSCESRPARPKRPPFLRPPSCESRPTRPNWADSAQLRTSADPAQRPPFFGL